jgi:hypothetical protein
VVGDLRRMEESRAPWGVGFDWGALGRSEAEGLDLQELAAINFGILVGKTILS